MKNKIIGYIVLVLVLIGGAFYGGMLYGKSRGGLTPQSFQNMTPEQRQSLFAGMRNGQSQGQGQGNRVGGNRNAGGFANGEIISQTDKNIVIKMRDGSSKIILLGEKTTINKTTEGAKADLSTGRQVMINGIANSDGTITAESITLSPVMPPALNNPSQPTDKK